MRIWARDARGELRGAGNGYRAVIYLGAAKDRTAPCTSNVYKGDNWISTKTHPNEASAKRYAEGFLKVKR